MNDLADPSTLSPPPRPPLTDAAKRALAEAEARRAAIDAAAAAMPPETNGRGGLEPARYGDWEVKGLAIDF
ncbi:MAG: DUF1674 domain-containing protein [Rhizobiaceae bacterium]|jgi:hypothetical protein|nr:DUF1674 domain-containing protein [Rhizobiaceae bacterium]